MKNQNQQKQYSTFGIDLLSNFAPSTEVDGFRSISHPSSPPRHQQLPPRSHHSTPNRKRTVSGETSTPLQQIADHLATFSLFEKEIYYNQNHSEADDPLLHPGRNRSRSSSLSTVTRLLTSNLSETYDEEGLTAIKEDLANKNLSVSKKQGQQERFAYQRPASLFEWVLAVLSAISAVLAASSIGPIFKYIYSHNIRPCLAASWRTQCMIVFLLPMALAEYYYDPKKNKVDWFETKPDLPYPLIIHIIFSGLSWAGNLLFWTLALQYCTAFSASVLSATEPIILIVFLQVCGFEVMKLEYLGIFVSVAGLLISCLEDAKKDNASSSGSPVIGFRWQLFGYCLCLLSSASEVIVIWNRITTRKYVPLLQYTFATTVVVTIVSVLASILLERQGVLYLPLVEDPLHPSVEVFCFEDHCIFGWLSKKWIWKILLFGFWVGVFCIAGFNYAVSVDIQCLVLCLFYSSLSFLQMQYIPPLIFSALTQLDPALTAFLCWVSGVESLPSLFSWVGGAIVMSGVCLISFAEHQKQKNADAEEERFTEEQQELLPSK
jgi:drug/metabolite transporter (DMT)-like permease